MSEHQIESFDVLLREKMAELDADEAPPVAVEDDPVERLALDASRSVRAVQLGPMPRGGHQVYSAEPAPPPVPAGQRHLNLVR